MPVLVRQAEARDLAAMAALRAREWESEVFWEDRIRRYLSGEHSPQQALAARAAFVAVDDETVVGFVSGHRTRRYECDGELQWINVVEQRRGSGIAGMLLVTIAGWFVQQGVLQICVNVDPKNFAARGLYVKYGARSLNDDWMVWEDARAMGYMLKR
jgi:GNAT superfamily N-acetyltransferase